MADQRKEENVEEQGNDVRKGKRKEMDGEAAVGTSKRRGRPSQGLTKEEKDEAKKISDRKYRANRTDKLKRLKRLEAQEKEMIAKVKDASQMVQNLKDEMSNMKESFEEEKKQMEATIVGLRMELAEIKMMNQQLGNEGNEISQEYWDELGDIMRISPLSTNLEENHEEIAMNDDGGRNLQDQTRSTSWSEELVDRILEIENMEQDGGVQGSGMGPNPTNFCGSPTASSPATTRMNEEIERLQGQLAKQNEEIQALKSQMSEIMLSKNTS